MRFLAAAARRKVFAALQFCLQASILRRLAAGPHALLDRVEMAFPDGFVLACPQSGGHGSRSRDRVLRAQVSTQLSTRAEIEKDSERDATKAVAQAISSNMRDNCSQSGSASVWPSRFDALLHRGA